MPPSVLEHELVQGDSFSEKLWGYICSIIHGHTDQLNVPDAEGLMYAWW
jgi:hypothetical protein